MDSGRSPLLPVHGTSRVGGILPVPILQGSGPAALRIRVSGPMVPRTRGNGLAVPRIRGNGGLGVPRIKDSGLAPPKIREDGFPAVPGREDIGPREALFPIREMKAEMAAAVLLTPSKPHPSHLHSPNIRAIRPTPKTAL